MKGGTEAIQGGNVTSEVRHPIFSGVSTAVVIPCTICLILFVFALQAQDYPRSEYNLEKLTDEIFPIQDLDLNYEELYENLAQRLIHPIDLNQATAEELRSLFILGESQVEELVRYREKQGQFLSLYELQAVPGFELETIHKLIPFAVVKDPSASIGKHFLKRVIQDNSNYLILRYERTLEDKKGFLPSNSSSRYLGSPDKLYSRFRVSRTGDYSFGFTFEKDPGEAFNWAPHSHQYGFDYNSFHAQLINKGKIKNIIVGDFQVQFGQGLLLGGGFGMGKGSESITTVRRSNLGFMPYTSVNEFGYFRGGAVTTSLLKNVYLSGFMSMLNRDGQMVSGNSSEYENTISSLGTTGLHRTTTELTSRKAVQETNYGMILNYKTKPVDCGLILHSTYFSVPIYQAPTPYNQFAFNGNQNTNVGAFLNYTWRNFTFFSEAGKTVSHGSAITLGALGNLSPKLDFSFLYRNFAKDFYSFYSNALSENTLPQSESGFYWGLKYRINKKYSWSGFIDLFQFPWLRYRGYSPSAGKEWLLRFNFQPTKTILLFVQAREESKIRNLSTDVNLYPTAIGTKRNFWFNADYQAAKRLSLKTRVQFSSYSLNGTRTNGIALVQDVNFEFGRFTFSTRYALFDTDDYDNRQYAYERDAWLAFSFPAYYGVGFRAYAMVQVKLTPKVDLWLRWAQTSYTDRDSIGSAGEQVTGNTKNDIKFQGRIRL